MKSLLASIPVIAAAAALVLALPAHAQTVTGAVARFHTNDDDRPKNSVLEVSIQTTKGEVLLKGAWPVESYEPETTHDIVLTIPAGLEKKQLAKSIAVLHYQPNPPEALKYDLHLELTFSDNSKLQAAWDKLYLDGKGQTVFQGAIYLP
jgi:hypothetical protein